MRRAVFWGENRVLGIKKRWPDIEKAQQNRGGTQKSCEQSQLQHGFPGGRSWGCNHKVCCWRLATPGTWTLQNSHKPGSLAQHLDGRSHKRSGYGWGRAGGVHKEGKCLRRTEQWGWQHPLDGPALRPQHQPLPTMRTKRKGARLQPQPNPSPVPSHGLLRC